MKCDKCQQNQATVHLTEVNNGEKVERHLCKECASEEGIVVKSHVPLDKMFNHLVDAHKEVDKLNEITCPDCNMNWAEFRKTGLLGCPNDYDVFGEAIEQVIARAHEGATRHIGRNAGEAARSGANQLKCMKLKHELQRALDKEDYEAAAKIRDEISQLSHTNNC